MQDLENLASYRKECRKMEENYLLLGFDDLLKNKFQKQMEKTLKSAMFYNYSS